MRIVVAQATAGPPDLIARFVAQPLGRVLGVPVVVENRPGASGIIGTNAAKLAAPAGYTLLIGTFSTLVLVPNAGGNVAYDSLRDFTPIVNLFRSVKVLWVNASLPAQNVREWVAYVSAHPGELNYASGGAGSSNHIDMELLKSIAALDIVHIPYNGPNAAITAVAAGDAQAMIVSIGTGQALAQSGRIRPIAVFAGTRSPLFPSVPTAAEQGLGHLELGAWIGLLAPAGTPEPIVTRLNAALTRILRSPEAIAWASRQGLEIVGGSSVAYATTLAEDHRRWGEILRRLQLRAE